MVSEFSNFLLLHNWADQPTFTSQTRIATNKTSPTLLLAKSVSQPTHRHRPLSYFQAERGQISPRVLTLQPPSDPLLDDTDLG